MRSTCMVLELLIDEVLDVLKKYVSFGDDVAIEIPYKQIFVDIINTVSYTKMTMTTKL